MNGCPLPVVINSGSGNQGLTITMPVLLYAEENQVDHDSLLRALAIANLMSIHQKRFIGSLSAYCGATSAACAAAVGICWLQGGSYEQICGVITNTLATLAACGAMAPSPAAPPRNRGGGVHRPAQRTHEHERPPL